MTKCLIVNPQKWTWIHWHLFYGISSVSLKELYGSELHILHVGIMTPSLTPEDSDYGFTPWLEMGCKKARFLFFYKKPWTVQILGFLDKP